MLYPKRGFAAAAATGREMLDPARGTAETATALRDWERRTGAIWKDQRAAFGQYLLDNTSLRERSTRLMLTRAVGVDFGDRTDDWERWDKSRRAIARGQQPDTPRSQRVRFDPLWSAPIGLTAWFTTIIPLDGTIYVASLGAEFDARGDAADGLVRVDGRTGESALVFSPPDAPPRDVIGIAAAGDGLFVACYNGFVYRLGPDGDVQWKMHVASAVVGPPVALDFNRDNQIDVVVLTRAGKVVALSGTTGKTVWVRTAGSRADERSAPEQLGATIAAGEVSGGAGPELVCTTAGGEVTIFSALGGDLRARSTLPGGSLAGAFVRDRTDSGGPTAYLGDRFANVWSVMESGAKLDVLRAGEVAVRESDTFVAALRTMGNLNGTLSLLATISGAEPDASGAAAFGPLGMEWRRPIPGAIWATPAVANLNDDRASELVFVANQPDPAGREVGVILIVSRSGHVLLTRALPAPVACSPVVADVNGDDRLELLVADQAGTLHCFATDGIGPVEWGLMCGDSANTRNVTNAYAWGQTRFGLQRAWRPR